MEERECLYLSWLRLIPMKGLLLAKVVGKVSGHDLCWTLRTCTGSGVPNVLSPHCVYKIGLRLQGQEPGFWVLLVAPGLRGSQTEGVRAHISRLPAAKPNSTTKQLGDPEQTP